MGNHFLPFLVGIVVGTFIIMNETSVIAAADISVDNNFENGILLPWIEESNAAVKWKIENRNSPWEPENKAPLPLNGSNYLRVDRGTSLAFGVAVLRSPVFRLLPGSSTNTFFSFSFWIRSKWPQFSNLELYLAKNGNEFLLLNLYKYSDVNNRDWRQSKVDITDNTNSNLTLVFYAYCGTATEDAVAIDDLYFSTDAILTTPTSLITTPSSELITTYPTSSFTDPISTDESSIGTTDSTLPTTSAEEKCPEFLQGDTSVPCYTIGTQCYCFYQGSSQLNWTLADQFCRDGNMTLLTIETVEEDESIYDHVKSNNSELQKTVYWTAGRYSQVGNGRWEWAPNQPFEPGYTHWGPQEPNGNYTTDEYCAFVDLTQATFSTAFWYDNLCATAGFKFICEQND